jgi:cystathionine gamma-synthase
MQLASYLASHELVQKVHYPGLVTHPQYDVASRQMQGGRYGGMLSFEMESEAMAMAVAGAVSTIQRGTSLGGTETLIEHRASIEPEDGRVSPKGLLRVSVGLEDFQDLKEDLRQAIDIAQKVMTVNPLQKRD